jgi:biotin carboxyl carrier protein
MTRHASPPAEPARVRPETPAEPIRRYRRGPRGPEPMPTLGLVRPSRWARRIAGLLGVLFVVVPLMLAFVPWRQSVEGAGTVVGYSPLDREFTVESPIYGRVKKWHVSEGSFVRGPRVEDGKELPGDLIAELTNNDPEYLPTLEASLRAVEDKLSNATIQAQEYTNTVEALTDLQEQMIQNAKADITIGEQKVEQVRNELEIARVDKEFEEFQYKRYEEAEKKGLITGLQKLEAERKYRGALQKLQKAEIEVAQAERDVAVKKTKLKEVEAKTQADITKMNADVRSANQKVAEYEKEKLDLQSKIRGQSTQEVRAPRDGIIKRLLVNEGVQQLKDTDPIAILTPQSPNLAVELYLDGNDTPLVHVGDPARLQFEGWPAVQFPGWPSVAVGTFAGKVALIDPAVTGSGKFRLLIVPTDEEPWPSNRYLRQGVQARGWVLLREVPLGFELWRRLNAFPPIVAPEEPAVMKDGKGKGGSSSDAKEKEEKVKAKRPK